MLFKRFLQSAVITIARPYIVRELLGWGKIYNALVGDYRRDWFWKGAATKTMRDKMTGYITYLEISHWGDRSHYFLGRWVDLEMQLLMQDLLKDGDVVIDVGANRGDFSLLASRLVGPGGKVISFEPSPNAANILNREISTNQIRNIELHEFGLGDVETVLEQDPVTQSFGTKSSGAVSVLIKKGDDVVGNSNPSFIKIDVEGFEYRALTGLADTIRRHHPVIVTELHPQFLEQCGSSVSEVVRLLRSHGYNGYVLGLKGKYGHYVWQASRSEFSELTESCDAIWVHASSDTLK